VSPGSPSITSTPRGTDLGQVEEPRVVERQIGVVAPHLADAAFRLRRDGDPLFCFAEGRHVDEDRDPLAVGQRHLARHLHGIGSVVREAHRDLAALEAVAVGCVGDRGRCAAARPRNNLGTTAASAATSLPISVSASAIDPRTGLVGEHDHLAGLGGEQATRLDQRRPQVARPRRGLDRFDLARDPLLVRLEPVREAERLVVVDHEPDEHAVVEPAHQVGRVLPRPLEQRGAAVDERHRQRPVDDDHDPAAAAERGDAARPGHSRRGHGEHDRGDGEHAQQQEQRVLDPPAPAEAV
jgi:hypothetical protein